MTRDGLFLGYQYYPVNDSNPPGVIIVGVVLLLTGLGVMVVRDDRRSRLGGVALIVLAASLLIPTLTGAT